MCVESLTKDAAVTSRFSSFQAVRVNRALNNFSYHIPVQKQATHCVEH